MPKKFIGDPVPEWMKQKPTTAMKMEWENACARWLGQNQVDAAAARRLNISPTNLLMLLRQEHVRW